MTRNFGQCQFNLCWFVEELNLGRAAGPSARGMAELVRVSTLGEVDDEKAVWEADE